MLNGLLDFGHNIYMDNFYNNVTLANYLYIRRTGVCGTLRKNRVPAHIRDSKLAKGESVGFRAGNVLIVKYVDKKMFTSSALFMMMPTENKPRAQKRCRVCWARDKVRRDVRYHCPTHPELCFPACFKVYHTRMDYC